MSLTIVLRSALFLILSIFVAASSTAWAGPPRDPDPNRILEQAEHERVAGRYRSADSLAWIAVELIRLSPPRSERDRLRLYDRIVACARQTTNAKADWIAAWARWMADRHDSERKKPEREDAWLLAAQSYRRAGQLDSAVICLARARAAFASRKGRKEGEDSRFLARVAMQHLAAGKSREMEEAAAAAIAAWKRERHPDSLTLATALVPRARVRLERSELDSARADLQFALSVRLRRLGPDHGDLLWVWRTVATSRALSDDLAGGMTAIAEALRVGELTRPEGDSELIPVYAQASWMALSAGKPVEACRYGRLGVEASERRFGPGSGQTANAKISLANALSHLGDIASALQEGKEAVAIQTRVLPAASAERAYGLSTLGSIELAAGRNIESYEHYRESARIREGLFGSDHMMVLYSLAGQAEAAERIGKLDEALQLQNRAARWQESHRLLKQLLESWNALARIQHRLGRDSLALATLDRAVALSDSLYAPDAAPAPDPRLQRIPILRALGRRAEAFEEALRLGRAERERTWRMVWGVSEREGLAAAESRSHALHAALELAGQAPRSTEDLLRAWDELAQSRALVFRVQAERRARAAVTSPGLQDAYARLDSARASLARAILRGPVERGPGAGAPAPLDSLRRFVEDAERRVAERLPDLGAEPTWAGIGAALRTLAAGDRLLAFVRIEHLDSDIATGFGTSDSAYAYLALIGDAHGRVDLVRLGDARPADERIERWRSLVRRPALDPRGERPLERRTLEAGVAVRNAVWDPVARLLRGARRVYVVPDGSIANVDWAALPSGRGTFLIESSPLLVSLASERDLAPRTHGGEGLLAMGSPDFNRGLLAVEEADSTGVRSMEGTSAALRFSSLPESGAEAREAHTAWTGAKSDARSNRLLLGALASEEGFRRDAPSSSVLHLATHGFILGPEGGASADSAQRGVGAIVSESTERPLAGSIDWTVAGLALAGANGGGERATSDDGLLTAAEIASLDLSRVRVAVLSACRTGEARGDQLESIQGLERGLRLAGVGEVVMSPWPVDDSDARAWMRAFYRAYLNGERVAEAVRAADLERLKTLRRSSRGGPPRPARWALFFARGEWE